MHGSILVVDDEAHILHVLSLKLRNAGHKVTTAVDGEEAFELACKVVPDLVITDFQMPYMTGLELCRSLAGNGPTSRIPVLILTARGYALDAEDLKIGNLKGVLSKPFSPRAVLQLVQEVLAGKSEDDEVADPSSEAA